MKHLKLLLILVMASLLVLSGCNEHTPGDSSDQPTTPATQPTAETQPPVVDVLPTGYEILNGFAKTPTHYYSKDGVGMVRAPIDNLGQQEKIPLPENYDGIRLTNAEICGITEDGLFVNLWEYYEIIRDEFGYEREDGDWRNRTCITFRIAMESWEAEVVRVGKNIVSPAPWYNPASDSLLIPYTVTVKNDEDVFGIINFEYMPLTTRKTSQVFLDGKPLSSNNWASCWINTPDGAALGEVQGDNPGTSDFYVFDRQNKVQLKTYDEMSFVEYFDEVPQTAIEELVIMPDEETRIWDSVTAGDFLYYLQYSTTNEWRITDLYRIKKDGTEQELLRENTNILGLYSVKDQLLCVTYTSPKEWNASDDEEHEIEICLLDNDGEFGKVLFRYIENSMGNSAYGVVSYDGKAMLRFYRIYSLSSFEFLYDTGTGVAFPAGRVLGN